MVHLLSTNTVLAKLSPSSTTPTSTWSYWTAATAPAVTGSTPIPESMVTGGKVTFHPNSEYLGGRRWISRLSGQHFAVPDSCRGVNAHYLEPDLAAE